MCHFIKPIVGMDFFSKYKMVWFYIEPNFQRNTCDVFQNTDDHNFLDSKVISLYIKILYYYYVLSSTSPADMFKQYKLKGLDSCTGTYGHVI